MPNGFQDNQNNAVLLIWFLKIKPFHIVERQQFCSSNSAAGMVFSAKNISQETGLTVFEFSDPSPFCYLKVFNLDHKESGFLGVKGLIFPLSEDGARFSQWQNRDRDRF